MAGFSTNLFWFIEFILILDGFVYSTVKEVDYWEVIGLLSGIFYTRRGSLAIKKFTLSTIKLSLSESYWS